jgi:glycosyltransferase involved in cell wall biosynthesis
MNQKKSIKVCHFTSVHPANDTRIFLKECRSAVDAGYKTVLVATNCEDGVRSGVLIKNVSHTGGRLKRLFSTAWKVYRQAKAEDADIYHFHDPELLPHGVLLRMKGKRVVYDAHEDVPEDILTKEWIYPIIRRCISVCFRVFEDWASRKMNQVIAATPAIRERFRKAGCAAVDINNYPIIGELCTSEIEHSRLNKSVCFIGVISDIRGAAEMVTAIGMTDCTLALAGEFSPVTLRDEIRTLPGWNCVIEHGQVSRGEVARILSESLAGLVLYHPGPNHTDSQPNKMFEYMSAGLPLIASDFPLWREIVEGNNCGLCVNPHDPGEIAKAINWLSNNPEEVKKMSENGIKAVNERYNWYQESTKLMELYREIVGRD